MYLSVLLLVGGRVQLLSNEAHRSTATDKVRVSSIEVGKLDVHKVVDLSVRAEGGGAAEAGSRTEAETEAEAGW